MKQLVLLCVLIFISCKSDPNPAENLTEEPEKAYVLTSEDIEKILYTDYILSPASSDAILDWQKYIDLQSQMELLKGGDLSFFSTEKGIMQEFILELKIQQPPVANTPAIRSRMTVLETNLLRFQNIANLDNIKKKDFLEALKELLVADANFKLQLNKKFEKEAQQIQMPVKTPLYQ